MALILHISDLHFGESLAPPNDNLLTSKNGAKKLSEILFYQINKLLLKINKKEIDGIIISGDITNLASAAHFALAENFITLLAKSLLVDINKVLVIPGNHDIDWSADGLENELKFESYKGFYKNLYDENWIPNKPHILTFRSREMDTNCVVFGLNSTMVENKSWSGMGYIDDSQFDYIQEWFNSRKSEEYNIRLAVLHHHVLPVHNYYPTDDTYNLSAVSLENNEKPAISIVLNASKVLKECKRFNINVILHGHSHAPFRAYQSNYLDENSKENRSITILGSGSIFSDRNENYSKKQFQIIEILGEKSTPIIHLHSFTTTETDKSIRDLEASEPTLVPVGKIIKKVGEDNRPILKDAINEIIQEYTIETGNSENSPLNKHFPEYMYDKILIQIIEWLKTFHKFKTSSAIISKFNPVLNIYSNIARYNYQEHVRYLAYSIEDENSITTQCAYGKTKPLIIKSVVDYGFHSQKRDKYYKDPFSKRDQTVLCFPIYFSYLNQYPYAIIEFARDKDNEDDYYTINDVEPVSLINEIIESALRQAEYSELAYRRRNFIFLINRINSVISEDKYNSANTDIVNELDFIVSEIFDHLGLRKVKGDALAMFLPKAPDFMIVKCFAEDGFGSIKSEHMSYQVGKREGLTGNIIDTRKFDYCINHLDISSKSYRGYESSRKCTKQAVPIVDHKLSFVGVPLGKGDEKYNKGALIINVALPNSMGNHHPFIMQMYVEPLQILSKILDQYIETKWKTYTDSFKKK